MVTKIQQWGNSQGLRLPKRLLEDVQLTIGDEVDISVNNGNIIIRPARRIQRRYKLEDLVAKIPEDYKTVEIDWGKAAGKEIW